MENLNLNPNITFYPIINFNYQTGICEIAGESYMEDTFNFYEPVINWLKDYTNEKKPVVFNVKLAYFNSSSSKFILEILYLLENYQKEGNSANVNWYYNKDDHDMLKEIDEFVITTGIKINIYTF